MNGPKRTEIGKSLLLSYVSLGKMGFTLIFKVLGFFPRSPFYCSGKIGRRLTIVPGGLGEDGDVSDDLVLLRFIRRETS